MRKLTLLLAGAVALVAAMLVALVVLPPAASGAPTGVSSCQTLGVPGAYALTADLAAVAGTGAGGRVTVEDFEGFLRGLEQHHMTPASPMRMAEISLALNSAEPQSPAVMVAMMIWWPKPDRSARVPPARISASSGWA